MNIERSAMSVLSTPNHLEDRVMFDSIFLALAAATVGLGSPAAETPPDQPIELAQADSTINVGTSTQGELASGDAVTDGRFVDSYSFAGVAGDRVRVSMRSTEIDTLVRVTGPDGFAVSNDDSPGRGTNSMIVVTIGTAGTYQVHATSYAPQEAGAYTLVVDHWSAESPQAQTTTAVAEPALADGANTGELTSDDRTLQSGENFDAYVYQGRAGERLSLSLRTDEFDPYLMVRGPGVTEDNDDVSEHDLNSGIDLTLPEDGLYRVIVTSYQPGERGRYTLTAGSVTDQGAVVLDGTLRVDAPSSGELSASDPTRQGGQYFESWAFEGTAGESITLELTSHDFDTFLILRAPNGSEESNDDISRRDTDSRINMILPESGTYRVLASSYLAGAEGLYSLSIGRADRTDVPVQSVESTSDGLALGASVEGRLVRRDAQLGSGEYYDTIVFDGRAGQGVTLTMESSQFDTYLMLRGPGDVSLDNDDAEGTNSRIETTLPMDGEYSILATSYAPGETGRYTVRLEEGTTVQRSATGRVYAVLAGITDYTDASDLPYCAEDAEKLGEELTGTGIMADESIVLTDQQVTRQNLEDAFRTVAQSAGPDDVFLFFYSGHGAFLEGRRELDGRDETLYLIDGHVTDDEVESWFDEVEARLAIIALDSCFSGGFARDVISAPNRMGIFSSEEDVTSNVASRFQAGGYLSFFLREGIGGAADSEPRDGIITAGELSQYLHRQWAEHNMANERTETSDAAAAYQNLVIDRGSVKVTDVIVYNR